MFFGTKYDEAEMFTPEGWDDMTWEDRVDAFLESEDTARRFSWPFPVGVFGTLRRYQGNNRLMHVGAVKMWRPAFLTHFLAHGLSVSCLEDGSAPFEVFFYEPGEWKKTLSLVDRLEGFDPVSAHGRSSVYYYRTLAWLRLIPEDHSHQRWFPEGRGASLWPERNMKIPRNKWADYERVPAWIYSNLYSNYRASKLYDSPVIWPSGVGD